MLFVNVCNSVTGSSLVILGNTFGKFPAQCLRFFYRISRLFQRDNDITVALTFTVQFLAGAGRQLGYNTKVKPFSRFQYNFVTSLMLTVKGYNLVIWGNYLAQ